MLSFFPTPYPGEWWYGILCRYAVRSGLGSTSAVMNELFGEKILTINGCLIPGPSCAQVCAKLPDDIFNIDKILLEHTLTPYFLRIRSQKVKKEYYSSLREGRSMKRKYYHTSAPGGKTGPKYCPVCYKNDVKKYGEAYWHREHQIPLLPLCREHGCRLEQVNISWHKLGTIFLPLASISCAEPVYSHEEWETRLSAFLVRVLELPFWIGPTDGYNNLLDALIVKGYRANQVREIPVIDSYKLTKACADFYSEDIMKTFFPKADKELYSKIRTWRILSPERYALLCVLIGMTADELFGEQIEFEDELNKRLIELINSGIAFEKRDVAEKLGVNIKRLNELLRKNKINAPWSVYRDGKGWRTENMHICVSAEEKELIRKAAKLSGGGKLAVYLRNVLLKEARKKIDGV